MNDGLTIYINESWMFASYGYSKTLLCRSYSHKQTNQASNHWR